MKIRTIVGLFLIFAVLMGFTGIAVADDGHGPYEDPRDDDGDGIPNGQDNEYSPPEDGDGYQEPQWSVV